MIGAAVDIFRLRQYFNAITRAREVAESVHSDGRLLDAARRAMLPLPFDRPPGHAAAPFLPLRPQRRHVRGRIGVVATGGSGALASVIGVARAFEEAGTAPALFSLCSGSAMFGFPLAAGVPADEVARFFLDMSPRDYVDVSWRRLAALVPTAGRGFAGLLDGERIEATFRRWLGDRCLGDLAVPAYAPIWSVETNRVEYLGTRTHPDLSVARAIHMAIALPLLLQPVALDGEHWCDGGIVDIFPVHPVLDIEPRCHAVIAVNGFYPPDFAGEDMTGWEQRRWSILYAASQVRTAQQVQLARENLARLRGVMPVEMIEPVPYEAVRGAGFYVQFLDNHDWPAFMDSGATAGRVALGRLTTRPHQQEVGA